REGGPAALGSEVERRREGIRRGYDDVREIDAELLGEDLRGAGEGGGADLRGARVEGDRPVRVDLHVDAGRAAGGRPPAAGEPLAAAGPGPAVLPADGRRRPHETLLQADAVEHLARRALVALVDDVPEPELERVEPERIGDDVHLRLDGEVRLRARRGPERPAV